MSDAPKAVRQCKTCPWREGAKVAEIPRYDGCLHAGLADTIQSGVESLRSAPVMACHYSSADRAIPCAGWLCNQLGVGNNFGVRLVVMRGEMPAPSVDGPQRARLEDTFR